MCIHISNNSPSRQARSGASERCQKHQPEDYHRKQDRAPQKRRNDNSPSNLANPPASGLYGDRAVVKSKIATTTRASLCGSRNLVIAVGAGDQGTRGRKRLLKWRQRFRGRRIFIISPLLAGIEVEIFAHFVNTIWSFILLMMRSATSRVPAFSSTADCADCSCTCFSSSTKRALQSSPRKQRPSSSGRSYRPHVGNYVGRCIQHSPIAALYICVKTR